MGDIKNPAIKQALKDFDDHEGGFDKVASKAKRMTTWRRCYPNRGRC
jgi:hypothetical protein